MKDHHTILHVLASVAAICGAWPFVREAVTHPSFVKRGYRAAAVLAIMGVLLLVFLAIWL